MTCGLSTRRDRRASAANDCNGGPSCRPGAGAPRAGEGWPDGLDLAEFSWYDPESSDGCYRAWDFQWRWYTCGDVFQVDQGGRALGKTVGITMRSFAFPFNFEGQKMLLTAPELNHLRPLTDAIEQRLDTTRLIRELRPMGKGGGINKQPHWQAKFTNNAQLVSRLPNKDGKGVKM